MLDNLSPEIIKRQRIGNNSFEVNHQFETDSHVLPVSINQATDDTILPSCAPPIENHDFSVTGRQGQNPCSTNNREFQGHSQHPPAHCEFQGRSQCPMGPPHHQGSDTCEFHGRSEHPRDLLSAKDPMREFPGCSQHPMGPPQHQGSNTCEF